MSTPTPRDESGWTIETYSAYNEALRKAQERLEEERDRRYSEVQDARNEALRVKEEGTKEALRLARAAQDYRDERDNRLREQIESERGIYLTKSEFQNQHGALVDKIDAQLKPLEDFVARQQGRNLGLNASAGLLYAVLVLAVSVITAVIIYTHHA